MGSFSHFFLFSAYPVDNSCIIIDLGGDLEASDAAALLTKGPCSLLVLADDIEDVLDILNGCLLLKDELE